MSHNEDFKDSTGVAQILLIIGAIVALPLLPMLMGWFTLLS
ncbi:MAG: hypothetical protein QF552_14350 [Litorilituus sp.]|jgi:hypothetical protein|nr:hypothetical protein [Litorilituus sp.]